MEQKMIQLLEQRLEGRKIERILGVQDMEEVNHGVYEEAGIKVRLTDGEETRVMLPEGLGSFLEKVLGI